MIEIDLPANVINVHRDDVLDGGFRGFQRASFNPHRRLNVRFSGEPAIDEGGPSREFMTLCTRALKNSKLFEGPDNARYLALDARGRPTHYLTYEVEV